MFKSSSRKILEKDDLREDLKALALRHSQFYRRLSNEPNVERLSSREDTLHRPVAIDVNVTKTVTAGTDSQTIGGGGGRLRGKYITCSSGIRSLSDKSFIPPRGEGEDGEEGATESFPGHHLNELRRSEEPLASVAFGPDARCLSRSGTMYEDLFKGTAATFCDREDDRQPLDCSGSGIMDSREGGCVKMPPPPPPLPQTSLSSSSPQSSRLCCFLGKTSEEDVTSAGTMGICHTDEGNCNDDNKAALGDGVDRPNGHKREVHNHQDNVVDARHNAIGNGGPTAVVATAAATAAVAINNKNKASNGEEWDRSNYLTFVPATSLARRFDCATKLSRCCSYRNGNNLTESITAEGKYIYSEEGEHQKQQVDDRCSNSSYSSRCEFQSLVQQRKKELFSHTFSKDYGTSDLVQKRAVQEEAQDDIEKFTFPCVENLVKMYTKLLEEKKSETATVSKDGAKVEIGDDGKLLVNSGEKITDMNRNSPISDEGCPTGQSPYSSDNEEIINEDGGSKQKEKVIRSSSSDSALGLEDDVSGGERSSSPTESPPTHNKGRRMTLTVTDIPLRPALLPLAEPTHLPDTSLQSAAIVDALLTQTAIPSKVLLEERVVEIPEDKFGGSLSNSRRESAQSCVSDFNSEYGVRYVRTPSVVVSDYSDDVMCGITLEEIEYFRQYRMRRRSSADTAATEKDETASDVSAASSCSNLYYCGSTISALDGADCYVNGIRTPIDRKISDCSTCSTVSGDEDEDSFIIHDFQVKEQHQQQQLQQQQQQQQQQQTRKTKKVRW